MSKEWELTDEELGKVIIGAGYSSAWICNSDHPIAYAAQKKLVKYLAKHNVASKGTLRHLELSYLNWQELCKELGIE